MGLEPLDHRQETGLMASSVFSRTTAFGRRLFRYLRPSNEQRRDDPLTAYFQHSVACGLNGLNLFLSFDCDTDWDIDVVMQLDQFLKGYRSDVCGAGRPTREWP